MASRYAGLVKKGTGGGESTSFVDLSYEIYGPSGVALLVEARMDLFRLLEWRLLQMMVGSYY